MPLRIDITEDLQIEIMIPRPGNRSTYLYYDDTARAMTVIKDLVNCEIAERKNERFVPQIVREAREEMRKLISERRFI